MLSHSSSFKLMEISSINENYQMACMRELFHFENIYDVKEKEEISLKFLLLLQCSIQLKMVNTRDKILNFNSKK